MWAKNGGPNGRGPRTNGRIRESLHGVYRRQSERVVGSSTPLTALYFAGCGGKNMRSLARLNWFKPSSGLSYVIAILGVSAAVVANLRLGTYLQASPTLFLFICAIIFAAWFGGVGPGVAATALSVLAFG